MSWEGRGRLGMFASYFVIRTEACSCSSSGAEDVFAVAHTRLPSASHRHIDTRTDRIGHCGGGDHWLFGECDRQMGHNNWICWSKCWIKGQITHSIEIRIPMHLRKRIVTKFLKMAIIVEFFIIFGFHFFLLSRRP